MKKNLLAIAGIALAFSSSAGAALVKYQEWAKSPEFTFLATDEDRKGWKKVASDEEAEKFVALFWARRDPDLKTAANEFKERFDALVKAADERFRIPAGKTRGALTERGKLFILLGPSKFVDEVAGTRPHGYGFATAPTQPGAGGDTPVIGAVGNPENAPGTTIGESQVTFTYEAQQLPAWAGVKPIKALFAVEQTRDSILSGEGDVRRVEKAAITAALKNPQLTEVPARAAAKAPVPPPPPAISAAAVAALEAAIAKAPFGAVDVLPLTRPDGETRLMIQSYLEGEVPAAPLRTAWLVRAKGGAEVARAEEPATPQKVLGGYVVDRVLPITPGEFEVAWVVLDAAGGVLREAVRSAVVPAPSADFHASDLLLAVADMSADTTRPDAPFVFAGRRYLSRGDGTVRTTDGLSYLVRLHGPGVDAATKKALLRPRVKIQPKGRKAMELPAAPDEPIAVTEGKNGQPPIVDIAGTIADTNIGEYFKPGEYTFTVTIEDAVKGTKLEIAKPFTVVAPPK